MGDLSECIAMFTVNICISPKNVEFLDVLARGHLCDKAHPPPTLDFGPLRDF